MAKCIKCGKEHKTTFKQWVLFNPDISEADICEDCIKEHKTYDTFTAFAENQDLTSIFIEALVPLDVGYVLLSQTLIGYCYGHPDDSTDYINYARDTWINCPDKRVDLLRQVFNDDDNRQEVLF